MKEIFFEIAPVVLTAIGAAIWIVTLAFNGNIVFNNIVIFCIIGQLSLHFFCGTIIQRLYKQANIDGLTGVYNRRCLITKIPGILKVKLPVSIMMIDIDNFKRINDTYGHSAGDDILKQVAEILKGNVRSTDIVVRLGGEEFAVVMPQTGSDNVLKTAERVRHAIEAECFHFESVSDKITISIGIITTKHPMSIECILKYADRALYKAKETKNAIVFNDTPGL